MKNSTSPKRREFLKSSTAFTALGACPTLATLATLSSLAEAASPTTPNPSGVASDYKAIVCVYFGGGHDHGNVLVPYQDTPTAGTNEYAVYAEARSDNGKAQTENGSNLSLRRSSLAASVISSVATPNMPTGFTTEVYGRQFALHPNFRAVRALYNQGRVAIIANTGPMAAPINRHQWFTRTGGARPLHLYSHEHQAQAWMSGNFLQTNPQEGIGGRIADQISLSGFNGGPNNPPQIPMLTSISGINTFMLTASADAGRIPYQIGVGELGKIDANAAGNFCNTSSSYYDSPANASRPYCLAGGPISLRSGYASNGSAYNQNGFTHNATIYNAFRNRLSTAYDPSNVYLKQWGLTMNRSINTAAAVSAALLANAQNEETVKPFREYVPSHNPSATPVDVVGTGGAVNALAAQLRMVATLIRASSALGSTSPAQPIQRQIFYVSIGGFDTHGPEFWARNNGLNQHIDGALDAFWQALGNIKVAGSATKTGRDQVTLFTMSEFGRTLDSNGQGCDHGWGGHQFVMGAAVKGGKIYGADHNVAQTQIPGDHAIVGQSSRYMKEDLFAGAMPRSGIAAASAGTGPGAQAVASVPNGNGATLPLNHCLERGELLPTTSSDAYLATIARWFGVPADKLSTVFPLLNSAHPNFDTDSGVGFINPV